MRTIKVKLYCTKKQCKDCTFLYKTLSRCEWFDQQLSAINNKNGLSFMRRPECLEADITEAERKASGGASD
jgi:hypothetical protein